MRFLGVGDSCDLASLYSRLSVAGHEVKVFIAETTCHSTMAGIVERVDDWEAELPWIKAAGDEGIILFENVSDGRGKKQDALRAQNYQVIGGSELGDRLENDRAYAQDVLRSVGMQTAPVFEFDDVEAAASFVAAHPKRYVLKFNGEEFASADNYVGRFPDGRDVIAMIRAKFAQLGRGHISFVLMEWLDGIEMGVGAYFNGASFLTPACLDWEHKRFFPGDMGELTGEMGTVATYEGTSDFFNRTLALVAPLLKLYGYCGYINLNTIVNADGIWPLEFTCRFGYPGYSILEPLQKTPWPEMFKMMLSKSHGSFETLPGFSLGVVMTTRPFPYSRTLVPEPIGLPIMFDGGLSEKDSRNFHYGEMALVDGQYVTAGCHGWTAVVTGTGPTILLARQEAYQLAERVVVPNSRYRNDIGMKLLEVELATLERLGILPPVETQGW